ncbi:MAG: dihydropteroate synthase [Alphaproteobacteria bacterium]
MRPLIMGVVNVTPDSFSDGGDHAHPDAAIVHARKLIADGADILDIGGESTRPGAVAVSIDEEMTRVLPVIEALTADGHRVSIDTRRAAVMAGAIKAGADMVNDVTALTGDGDSIGVVADSDASVVLMHMQGAPDTMQDNPQYTDAASDVRDYLAGRIEACVAAGIDRARICVDPGFGFGKTLDHNLAILKNLSFFGELGCPVVLGVSRKSFICEISGEASPRGRLGGSLAAALAAVAQGVDIVRVHDVAETAQALAVWDSLQRSETKS